MQATLDHFMYTDRQRDFIRKVFDQTVINVKMNVQTMYYGKLLRKGKIYPIKKETAKRWIVSKIAEKVDEKHSTI